MIYTIGEALIDFIPKEIDCDLKDVSQFSRVVGGAPCNVAGAIAKLNGKSALITQLGYDAFGDHIMDVCKSIGVCTEYISRTSKANTGLAFVSLKEDGSRDFSFYRNPSADLLLTVDDVSNITFNSEDYLHFCSVDLVESPMKKTHQYLIEKAQKEAVCISFDPNVRLPLWSSAQICQNTINDFIGYADILKIADDELFFITSQANEKKAIQQLFTGNVKVVIYTQGANGAKWISKNEEVEVHSLSVDAIDTTGAGDAFIGAILSQLQKRKIGRDDLLSIHKDDIEEMLLFASKVAAFSVQRSGAIASYPSLSQLVNE